MWVVKNKGGSPVKAASINKNVFDQAKKLGFSTEAAEMIAQATRLAQDVGRIEIERILPPPMDWSLNGSFNLWLDANNPLYFEKVGTPTLTRKESPFRTYMSQFSCFLEVDAGDGIRQIVSLWSRDDYGPNIYYPRFEVPWTLLLHICDVAGTSGSWRLRLGWWQAPPFANWSGYREIVFNTISLPQFGGEVWPAVLVHLPPNKDAKGELIFELVAQTTGKILIDSIQLLPGEFNQDTYPIWAPPALQPVEINWSKDGAVGAGTYRIGHTISPIKLSAFKVTAGAGIATTITPRVGGIDMANLAVTLDEGITTGMAHYPQGYYCSLNSLLDLFVDVARDDICTTLFGIRLPW